MGAHSARQPSMVGKVAGRGALTAAAALALTGGTASFAFADEPNFEHTAATTQTAVTDLAGDLEDLPSTELPGDLKDGEALVGDHVASLEDKGASIAAAGAEDLAHAVDGAGGDGDAIRDGHEALSEGVSNASQELHHTTGSLAAAGDEELESVLSFS